ncbi:unnamed protein product, partial [Rotaria sp. Silwood2]
TVSPSVSAVGSGNVSCIGSQYGSLTFSISAAVPCTYFSVSQDMSAEQDSTIINLPPNIKIALQFADGNWAVITQIR